jgi:hypothetical protein
MNCKHLYYIFVKVSNLDAEVNLFIHAPTFSFNEVKLILEGGLLLNLLPRIPLSLALHWHMIYVSISGPLVKQ